MNLDLTDTKKYFVKSSKNVKYFVLCAVYVRTLRTFKVL